MEIGGLVSPTDEHLRWSVVRPKVGDEIRIRIRKTDKPDEPRKRYRDDPAKVLEAKKNCVRRYAKELGWTIFEHTKHS